MRFIGGVIVCVLGFVLGVTLWLLYSWILALAIAAAVIAAGIIVSIIGIAGKTYD